MQSKRVHIALFVAAFVVVSALAIGLVFTRKIKAPQANIAGVEAIALRPWMRANALPALQNEDFGKLATAYTRIGQLAPREPGFESWARIANDGARAAENHDSAGVHASCAECHTKFRPAYRARSTTSNANAPHFP